MKTLKFNKTILIIVGLIIFGITGIIFKSSIDFPIFVVNDIDANAFKELNFGSIHWLEHNAGKLSFLAGGAFIMIGFIMKKTESSISGTPPIVIGFLCIILGLINLIANGF